MTQTVDNISLASFWKPEYLPQSAWHTHAPFAFWLIDAIRPRRIVELGTHAGFSFFTFCQALQSLGLDSAAFAVDTWAGDEHAGHYKNDVFEGVASHNARYAAFSTLLRTTFDDARRYFEDGSVDLLHIDGRHFYDDVKSDYESWLPKLTDDAVVLFHDTNVRERDFGVWRFFGELSLEHPAFDFVHGHGLGVLCPSGIVPDPLKRLMSRDEEMAKVTRQAYSMLGQAVLAERQALVLRSGIEALHRSNVDLTPGGIAELVASLDNDTTLRQVASNRAAEAASFNAVKAEADAARLEADQATSERNAAASKAEVAHGESLAAQSETEQRRQQIADLSLLLNAARAEADAARLKADRATSERNASASMAEVARGESLAAQSETELRRQQIADLRLLLKAQNESTRRSRDAERVAALLKNDSHLRRMLVTPAQVADLPAPSSRLERALARARRRRPDRIGASSAASLPEEAQAVERTGLFDPEYYRETYEDIRESGVDPLVHFSTIGWKEGRNPSASFDTQFYLAHNRDIAGLNLNPLLHYAEIGAAEGRAATPELLAALSDLSEDDHLIETIVDTGFFDREFYDRTYSDVAAGGGDPALHFARVGWKEGRNPGPSFNTQFYLEANPDVAETGLNPLVHFARHGVFEGRISQPIQKSMVAGYSQWVAAHDTLTDDDRRAIRSRVARLSDQPLISIVMPVYNTNLTFLEAAIDSVRAQLYPHWELCIADDASTSPGVAELLARAAERDARIKVMVRQHNGHISASSNSAIALATGEFVALMDHDDVLPEHALFTVVAHLNENPEFDLIYSDEDHIDENGRRLDPYFKSDFNYELFLGHNIISHFGVYRRSILNKIGGFRLGYEGSQDYDLALRFIDEIDHKRILHIPSILYHWRSPSGENTFSQAFLDRCIASAQSAIRDHFDRRGQRAEIVAHPIALYWNRIIRPRPDPAPLVSVIVPTKDKLEVLKPCCDGLLQRTAYSNIELIVIDHNSSEQGTLDYLSDLARDARVRIWPYDGPFNYAAMNNAAVAQAKGDLVCFLNNDVEVIEGDWLDEMVSIAVLDDVGAVGAKLLYPNNHVQHGGVLIGAGGVAGHLYHLREASDPGDMGRAVMTSAVSAVTAACLLVKKSLFEQVGGFDEHNLPVAFNDVDFCLKLREAGYRNVFAAHAILFHHESLSRGLDLTSENAARFKNEAVFMMEKWGDELLNDPFYNLNLDLSSAEHRLAFPPRYKRRWLKQS